MFPNAELKQIHQVILDHKTHLVVHHGEYDMPPIMALRWRDHIMQQVDLDLCITKLNEGLRWAPEFVRQVILDPPRIIDGILAMVTNKTWPTFPSVSQGMLRVPDVPLEGIWLSLEQFHDTRGIEDITELPIKGDIQHDFETNPDSSVLEAVATYVIETGATGIGEWARLTTCHRRVEGGGVEWLETEIRRGDESPIVPPEQDMLIDLMVPYVTRESLV
jgi:hypothetical protein